MEDYPQPGLKLGILYARHSALRGATPITERATGRAVSRTAQSCSWNRTWTASKCRSQAHSPIMTGVRADRAWDVDFVKVEKSAATIIEGARSRQCRARIAVAGGNDASPAPARPLTEAIVARNANMGRSADDLGQLGPCLRNSPASRTGPAYVARGLARLPTCALALLILQAAANFTPRRAKDIDDPLGDRPITIDQGAISASRCNLDNLQDEVSR